VSESFRGSRHPLRVPATARGGSAGTARQREARAGAGAARPRPPQADGVGRAPHARGGEDVSLISLAAALALSLVDPTGDAAGDGTLEPPTSPVYANAALFDLQELSVTEGTSEGDPAKLRVAMGAVEVDESQPAGFNRAVVDVYLDFVDGGADATLAGPGMLMPAGRGWDFAVRVSPSGAFGAPAPLDDGQVVEWAPLEMALDGDVF